MKKLLLAAAIFCSTVSAKAQTWDTVMNGIKRSSFDGLYPTCTEVLHLGGNTILGASTGGIYKSTNYGDNWIQKTTNFQGYNGVRKIKSGRIIGLGLPIMAGMYSVAKSDDNGDTWTNASSGLPAQVIVEDMVQTPNGHLYIACRQPTSVYVSTDNGDSWTSKSTGIPTGGLTSLWAIEAVDNDTLVVGEYNGIYRSTDAGANWTKVKSTSNVSAMKKHPNGTIYCGFASGVLQKSTDFGKTWGTTSMFSSSNMIYDIEIDKSENIYFAVFNGGVTKYSSAEAPLGLIASTTMGMTYPRVQDFMIDETGSSPVYMAATMNSATISGYFYRAGYTPTGIQEKSMQKAISLYPNPAQNSLNIAGFKPDSKAVVRVYGIDGKKYLQQAIEGGQLNISSLTSGLYILQIENGNDEPMMATFEKR